MSTHERCRCAVTEIEGAKDAAYPLWQVTIVCRDSLDRDVQVVGYFVAVDAERAQERALGWVRTGNLEPTGDIALEPGRWVPAGLPYLEVALRDAMDRMRAAEAKLQEVQDLVDEGSADEPCAALLKRILAGAGR